MTPTLTGGLSPISALGSTDRTTVEAEARRRNSELHLTEFEAGTGAADAARAEGFPPPARDQRAIQPVRQYT